MQAEVTRDFEPSGPDGASQLRLAVGDRLRIMVQDESGWWAGHKEGSDVTGWFPRSVIALPTPSSSSSVSHAPPSRKALSTFDGRRVASPQVGKRVPLSKISKPGRQQEQPVAEFMKKHAEQPNARPPQQTPGSVAPAEPQAAASPSQCERWERERLESAFEFEKIYVKRLEEELQCVRELIGREVRQAALEKAWQVAPEPLAESSAAPVSKGKMVTKTVRDLVAVFEHRATTSSSLAASANLPLSAEAASASGETPSSASRGPYTRAAQYELPAEEYA